MGKCHLYRGVLHSYQRFHCIQLVVASHNSRVAVFIIQVVVGGEEGGGEEEEDQIWGASNTTMLDTGTAGERECGLGG